MLSEAIYVGGLDSEKTAKDTEQRSKDPAEEARDKRVETSSELSEQGAELVGRVLDGGKVGRVDREVAEEALNSGENVVE